MKRKFLVHSKSIPCVIMLVAYCVNFTQASLAQSNNSAQSEVSAVNKETAKPKIVVDDAVFNFSTVNEGEVVRHSFRVSNAGDSVLDIRDISADCGCVVAAQNKFLINPGEFADINVEFNTTGFYGRKVKTLRLFTNDTENTTMLLSLKGFIKREAVANPPSVFFGDVKIGTGASQVVSVNLKSDVTIKDVYSHSQFISLNKTKDYADGNVQVPSIDVTLSKSTPIGVFRDNVFVRTTSDKQPIVTIPVFARVVGSVQVDPPDVSFGLVEKPILPSMSKRIKLVGDNSNIRIVSVESGDAQVLAEMAKGKGGINNEVEVSLDPNANGTIRTEITIVTNYPDKEQRELVVRVYAIVTERRAGM